MRKEKVVEILKRLKYAAIMVMIIQLKKDQGQRGQLFSSLSIANILLLFIKIKCG